MLSEPFESIVPSFDRYSEESGSPSYRVPENNIVTVDELDVMVNLDTLVLLVKFTLYVMCVTSFLVRNKFSQY